MSDGDARELVVTLRVLGDPVPQGQISRSATGRAYSTNHKRLKPWRAAIAKAVVAQAANVPTISGPVFLSTCHIFLPRPRKHYRTGRFAAELRADAPAWPIAHNLGDVDKHLRAILDGLTEAGLLEDDALVVRLGSVEKLWADSQEPGAVIQLEVL